MLAACGARPRAAEPLPLPHDRVAIIASERGPSGARLVAIDELGDRRHVLIAEASGTARDTNPAVSPDGRWIVFASSRDRPLDETSLWIAPLGVEAPPVRLTSGPAIDAHPTWTHDGTAIVFASTRDGGDFDLWRLPITRGRASGAPEQLTNGAGHEVTPTVAADGTIIYSAVTPLADHTVESHLERRAPDGTITRITEGPADSTPALSPDGTTIAFSRTSVHDGRPNTDIWRLRRIDGVAEPVIALPLTDESGPVWSRDGAFLFATSALRGEQGVVFSSVIHVELGAATPVARMLEDHAGGIPRLTPAIVAPVLDAAALRRDPEYVPALARIMAKALEQARQPESP